MTPEELVRKSHEAKAHAHCPYSNFRVGAALLTDNSTVYTGCNVENASFSLTICAERTAIVKAVSEGHRKFKAMAISSDMSYTPISPCGGCRQVMLEFGADFEVYLSKPDLSYVTMTTSQLLPISFTPDTYTQERQRTTKPRNRTNITWRWNKSTRK